MLTKSLKTLADEAAYLPAEIDRLAAILVKRILSYLRAHPRAADTCEGIGRWWLGGHSGMVSPESLQRALDDLVACGFVRCRKAKGGEVIYSLAEPRNEKDE